ncbi:chemotaxis response regulator protein-glutamate methylesterase CheB [Vibrio maritimus]|uniref:protein-glutamate methylesterase n=1 Tax=Vibrio maritimus TaxID=990268 RepID=A0A090T398_9VIBR|nr:chemotaxis response regulator protein-glutamate methylesterase CheB [Vibrio maritimus]
MSTPSAAPRAAVTRPNDDASASKAAAPAARFRSSGKSYQLTAIGTSTGGPVALQKILTKLPGNYPHPILLIQHMPATFTAAFAARLNSLCQITVKEAANGDVLQPGVAYLAPGGMQMMIEGRPGSAKIRILDGGERMNYKPCVDVTFGSAAKIYHDKVLSMVLTGMGLMAAKAHAC